MKNTNVYKAAQFKAMDDGCGIATDRLMENAARALYDCLDKLGRLEEGIGIICGKGNNGGDGYALACILQEKGKKVWVWAADTPASELAKIYSNKYINIGGAFTSTPGDLYQACTVIVDCLFGFSFKGELNGVYKDAVERLNAAGLFVLAADIPSGLVADRDCLPSLYVKANATCTFTAYKIALVSQPAKSACGKVIVADIGIPRYIMEAQTPYGFTFYKSLLDCIHKRDDNSHKGTHGTMAALCGSEDMSGAAYLACNGALRTGVGIVRLYTDKNCAFTVKTMLPECIVAEGKSYPQILNKASALLIGCGCGRQWDDLIKELLKNTEVPTVLDADGINATADSIELYRTCKSQLIITPHPGEFARLIGKTVAQVNQNRAEYARAFALENGIITVLKGNATVVAAPEGGLYFNNTGNPGMAKGGSGDVLAGIITSLLAQGVKPFMAAVLGVYLHGAAGDTLAREKGHFAMLPSELGEIAGKIMYFG